jgi:hypothetical protein
MIMRYVHFFAPVIWLALPFTLLWTLLTFASPPMGLAGDALELTSFLTEIQAASDQVRSFSSEFVQERRLALFNGERGIRCNDQAPPVHFDLGADPIMKTVAEQLWLWLGGDYSRLNASYHLAKSGPSSLRITPKEQRVSEYISAITITFHKTSRQPEKVEIADPGGDTTILTFQAYVLNSDTPDVLFSLCGTDE